MPTISSAGIGSGLDIASLVQQLLAAERQPVERRLAREESRANAELSALGTLRSALSGLRDALAALRGTASFAKRSAISADANLFAATAAAGAAPGAYEVEVRALATAHKLASGAFPGGASTLVGSGTLTIGTGAQAFSVSFPAASSLTAIRDAINGSADNPGVTASIVNAVDGAHLVLSADETGAAHALRVTRSGGDGGLDALVYDPGALESLVEATPADDAEVRIDGLVFTSASNTISGAVDGLTLRLARAEIGTKAMLHVGHDHGAVTDAVNAFVSAYNSFIAESTKVTRYDPASKTAAALFGDAAVRGIGGTLRALLGDQITGLPEAFDALSDLGITTSLDGTLTVDAERLDAALATDHDAVAALLGGAGGFAPQLAARLDDYLAADGQIRAREDGAQARLEDLAGRRDALARRLESREAQLMAQFTALDSLVAQMQSTSSFLTQQLASLNQQLGR